MQSKWIRLIRGTGVVFYLAVLTVTFIGNARAADPISDLFVSKQTTTVPTTGTLPSGETAAEFLIRQVGGGFAELTTDTQKKKPLQLLMEELVLADGRKNAKGKWIDDIPDTKPAPLPDIAPQLTTMTLYYDKEAVNAHWEAFQKRYYLTANYIKDKIGRPLPPRLPGEDLDKWLETHMLNSDKKKLTSAEYAQKYGGLLLYMDFLCAHGDAAVKKRAFATFRRLQAKFLGSALGPNVVEEAEKTTFLKYALLEVWWPMLNPEAGYYDSNSLEAMEYILENKTDKYRMQKWMVNHVPTTSTAEMKKITFLTDRSNEYVRAQDYTGAMFSTVAATPMWCCYIDTLHNMEIFFTKQYGPDKGRAYYRRYLECIVSQAPGTDVKNELARLTKSSSQKAVTPQGTPPPNTPQPQNGKKR